MLLVVFTQPPSGRSAGGETKQRHISMERNGLEQSWLLSPLQVSLSLSLSCLEQTEGGKGERKREGLCLLQMYGRKDHNPSKRLAL